MAINQYIVTTKVVLPAGAFTADDVNGGGAPAAGTGYGAPANFGTGSYAQGAGVYGSGGSLIFNQGQKIMLDPTGKLFTAIGSGNLRLVTAPGDGATGGYYGTSN